MSHLLQPLDIGPLHLHNRLVFPPIASSKASPDGLLSDELYDYYNEKSAGGAIGLIITEHSYVTKQGQNRPGQPSVAGDETVAGWQRLTEMLHRNGSACVCQINHSGAAATTATTGLDVVAPSAITSPTATGENVPRPLTVDDIATVVGEFAAAARRVQEAGFDGVEVHAAHGYLLSQFLSPITNHRTDGYGGSLPNRVRIHLEVVGAVRDMVGPDFPVFVRLGSDDFAEGGTTIDDAVYAAIELERAGMSALDVSGGINGYVRPGHNEPGYLSYLSRAIREAVSVPVVLTGGVTEAAQAESLLAAGEADLIGVGRAILRDSRWAAHAVASLT